MESNNEVNESNKYIEDLKNQLEKVSFELNIKKQEINQLKSLLEEYTRVNIELEEKIKIAKKILEFD